MVLSRTAVLLCVPAMALAGAVTVATPAIADCSGPHISFSPEVAGPGQAIVVTGEAFGDACHDTGVPPTASGVLGEPRDGLAIVVMQGEDEFVVAEGNADGAYGFAVSIVLPETLRP